MRELCRGIGPINRMLFRDKDDFSKHLDFKIKCQTKM